MNKRFADICVISYIISVTLAVTIPDGVLNGLSVTSVTFLHKVLSPRD